MASPLDVSSLYEIDDSDDAAGEDPIDGEPWDPEATPTLDTEGFETIEGDTLDAALFYASRGLRVIPLHAAIDGVCTCRLGERCGAKNAGKHPRLSGWPEEATTDTSTLRRWWGKWRTCNVGLPMGGEARLVALDIDGAEGRASLAALESEHGALPRTLTSRSGREDGGEHRLFTVPARLDASAIKNAAGRSKNGRGVAPGIDVRSEGGQIAVAPSVHSSGGVYRWIDASPPAELPEWLYRMMAGEGVDPPASATPRERDAPSPRSSLSAESWPRRYARLVLEKACDELRQTPRGSRNDAANREAYGVAGYLWTGAFGAEEIVDALTSAMRAGGWDPMAEERHVASIRGAIAAGEAERREVPKAKETRPKKGARVSDSEERDSHEREDDDAPAPRRLAFERSDTPRIRVVVGEIPRMVREAIAALAEGDTNLFQRAGELVTITREPERAETPQDFRERRRGSDITLRPGTPRLRTVGAAVLTERLATFAAWERMKKDGDDWIDVPADPPARVVAVVGGRQDWPGIRPIRGILEAPSLRPDGTVISTPGYDDATGYVLLPSCEFPGVAEHPSQEDAAESLRRLWIELCCDFPFQGLGEADPAWRETDPKRYGQYERARTVPDAFVGIAALLTIVARPAILGAVPGAVFEAAAQGSGKTLQINAISTVATGRPAGVMTFPAGRHGEANEEELEKVLAAYALAGSRVIAFDNVKCTLGGPSLEKTLTAVDTIDLRVLGASDLRTMPWSAVELISGNNLTMSDDIAQRVLVSRLESPREDPRGRGAETFRSPELLSSLRELRPTLIRDALTVLRALFVSDPSKRPPPASWGSFEAWSRLVPPAIAYAGGPNVLAARPRVGETGLDLESEAHQTLLRDWPCPEPARAAEVLSKLFENEYEMAHGKAAPDGRDDVRAAVRSLSRAQDGRVPNIIAFGKALGRLRGKIRSGMKLTGVADRNSVIQWAVTRVQSVDNRPIAYTRPEPVAPPPAPPAAPVYEEDEEREAIMGDRPTPEYDYGTDIPYDDISA